MNYFTTQHQYQNWIKISMTKDMHCFSFHSYNLYIIFMKIDMYIKISFKLKLLIYEFPKIYFDTGIIDLYLFLAQKIDE